MTNKQIITASVLIVLIAIIVWGGTRNQVVAPEQPAVSVVEDSNEVVVPAPAQGKRPAGSAPAADPKLLIGTWVWQRTVVRDAPIITPKAAGKFAVTFSADGKINGTTDCNSYFGTYKVGSDSVITVGNLGSTLMFCEGSQEMVFTSQLATGHQYSFDDKGNLLINFDNDAGSMVFVKK